MIKEIRAAVEVLKTAAIVLAANGSDQDWREYNEAENALRDLVGSYAKESALKPPQPPAMTVPVIVDGVVEQWPGHYKSVNEFSLLSFPIGKPAGLPQFVPIEKEGYMIVETIDGKFHAMKTSD